MSDEPDLVSTAGRPSTTPTSSKVTRPYKLASRVAVRVASISTCSSKT